ncbi:unnamed protein product [Cuscuta campestris]|uniref:Uncharacterized protein n=1 Tax=Cuscuta campestris TaxID=132261 RepID=A0A484LNW8_9ASTE|nr:unnamed protein product [Cuscuta campestris]
MRLKNLREKEKLTLGIEIQPYLTLRHPSLANSFNLESLKKLILHFLILLRSDDVLDSVLCNSLDRVELECLEYSLPSEVLNIVEYLAEFEELENLSQPVFRAELLENKPKLAPSLVSPPKLELKDLPEDLKAIKS